MIDDVRYLTVLDNHAREIMGIIVAYNSRADDIPVGDKDALLALRREQNRVMIDKLQEQARALAFMAGEQVDPVMHFGEAVLVGIGGQGQE